jgi:CheY-like chemotaxis protein
LLIVNDRGNLSLSLGGPLALWRNARMPICLLLAEDHVLVRQGLRVLLEQAGMIVVGEVSDGPDALRLAHGRDEAVALPSPRYHAPASQWQPSPESNVRQTVLRCLTGDVYPLPDLAARPTSRAPMSDQG